MLEISKVQSDRVVSLAPTGWRCVFARGCWGCVIVHPAATGWLWGVSFGFVCITLFFVLYRLVHYWPFAVCI